MIVHNYLWSGAEGSMGGATFQKWKGKQTVRTKPTSVENPRTPAQLLNRAKFAILTILARLFRPAVIPGMKEQATDMTEYNAFVKYNIKTAITGTTADNVAVAYADLVVSRGTAPQGIIDAYDIAGNEVLCSFTGTINNPIPDGSVLHVLVYNPTTDVLSLGTGLFEMNNCDFQFPTTLVNTSGAFAYFFYVNAVTGKVSDSQVTTGPI